MLFDQHLLLLGVVGRGRLEFHSGPVCIPSGLSKVCQTIVDFHSLERITVEKPETGGNEVEVISELDNGLVLGDIPINGIEGDDTAQKSVTWNKGGARLSIPKTRAGSHDRVASGHVLHRG